MPPPLTRNLKKVFLAKVLRRGPGRDDRDDQVRQDDQDQVRRDLRPETEAGQDRRMHRTVRLGQVLGRALVPIVQGVRLELRRQDLFGQQDPGGQDHR